MVVSATITAFSQILLKKSANISHKGFLFEYLNPLVIAAYMCYVGVLVLNVFIYTKIDYRFGVVINALSTVFVMVLSKILLKEKITRKRVLGNVLIVAGVLVFMLL